jgi:hypothetical protein
LFQLGNHLLRRSAAVKGGFSFNKPKKQEIECPLDGAFIVIKPDEIVGTGIVKLADFDMHELSVRLDENILYPVFELGSVAPCFIIGWLIFVLEFLAPLR